MADTLFPVFDVPELEIPAQTQNRQYKPSVYFDYDIGDFRQDGAFRMVPASGRDTYIQWCRKVVMTERDVFLAYSTDIGVELESAFALADRAAVESALEKTISEALMVNTHTEYVRGFEFTWSADELRVAFTVKGKDWDEVPVSVAYNST